VTVEEPQAGSDLAQTSLETTRLWLLPLIDDGLSDVEVLPFALDQAVTALGGFAGMAHRLPEADDTLRLAAVRGLPRSSAERWDGIGLLEGVPPARAVLEQRPVHERTDWAARIREDGESGGPTRERVAALLHGLPDSTGIVSLPFQGGGVRLGAMTVLFADPSAWPGPQHMAFLEQIAERVGARLRRSRAAAGVLRPTWWQEPSGSHFSQAMRAISVGAWDWDMRTGRLLADDTALNAVGLARETFDERVESWAEIVHPDDAASVFAEIDRAVAERSAYGLEYRVCRPGGDIAWIEARGYITFGEGGKPLRMTGTLWETTETRQARDTVGRALRHMSDGFLAVDDQWRILYCNTEAEHVLGASGRLPGRVLWDAAPDADAFGLEERYRRAAVEGSPVGFDVQAPGNGRWYHMRLLPVPGGLTVYFTDVTRHRAQRMQQIRDEQDAARRAARIEELTRALAQALTVRDVVRATAEHILPLFGATGLLVAAVDEDNRLRTVGSRGYPGPFRERFDGMALTSDGPAPDVMRARVPLFFPSVEDFTARYPHLAYLAVEGGKEAWAFMPLIASGREVGCGVVSFDRPRTLDEEERTLLVALSGLVAHALERARLFDAEHTRAKELQRGMLPRTLPALPAVTTAARYVPAAVGAEVGGDWYDVIPLSAERVALVVGDVMGHGLSEAVMMGRLRTAVHTLSDLEIPPDELLARLDRLVSDLGDAAFVTCLYAVYDPTTCVLSFSTAGHPPPAVLHPDGTVRFPDVEPDPPLGVASPPLRTEEMKLPVGSVLVLYTDGLVEAPGTDIDTGMDRLAQALAGTERPAAVPGAVDGHSSEARGGLEALCDALIASLMPRNGRADDDAAVLVVRTRALDEGDVASWPLPDDPVAAGHARSHVRAQLSLWGLDDLAMTTELLASELVGNVVRHAKGPVQLRLLRGRTLICEVSDGSLTTPRIRHASEYDEGGRGLHLVSALSHRWGARYTAEGKCIWTEQLRTPPVLTDFALL
jgi:PAS domain-containing protein/anti-sigma regulatory factor (Ser/Thr protein kinase)